MCGRWYGSACQRLAEESASPAGGEAAQGAEGGRQGQLVWVQNWSSKLSQDPSIMEITRELLSSLTRKKWAPFALWAVCMFISHVRIYYLVSNFGSPISFLELLRTCILEPWYCKVTPLLCPEELKLFQTILDSVSCAGSYLSLWLWGKKCRLSI